MLYDAFGYATVDGVMPSDLLLFVYQVSDGLVVEVFFWNVFWIMCTLEDARLDCFVEVAVTFHVVL